MLKGSLLVRFLHVSFYAHEYTLSKIVDFYLQEIALIASVLTINSN